MKELNVRKVIGKVLKKVGAFDNKSFSYDKFIRLLTKKLKGELGDSILLIVNVNMVDVVLDDCNEATGVYHHTDLLDKEFYINRVTHLDDYYYSDDLTKHALIIDLDCTGVYFENRMQMRIDR